jgi:tRNA(Phe) wybutosine-synthesizing methylase Tyw3
MAPETIRIEEREERAGKVDLDEFLEELVVTINKRFKEESERIQDLEDDIERLEDKITTLIDKITSQKDFTKIDSRILEALK